jgi:hypothetical protein
MSSACSLACLTLLMMAGSRASGVSPSRYAVVLTGTTVHISMMLDLNYQIQKPISRQRYSDALDRIVLAY